MRARPQPITVLRGGNKAFGMRIMRGVWTRNGYRFVAGGPPARAGPRRQRTRHPLRTNRRPAPVALSPGGNPRGWSAERRIASCLTPFGVASLVRGRSPPGAPSRFRSGPKTRVEPRAGFPGTRASSPCPSPASTLQSGPSAARLDARSLPGAGVRAPPAGAAPFSAIETSRDDALG